MRPPEVSVSAGITFQGNEEEEAKTTLSTIFKEPQTTCAGHAEPHKISPSSNLAKPKKKKSDAPPPKKTRSKKTRSKKHKRVNNVRNSISICFVWFDV